MGSSSPCTYVPSTLYSMSATSGYMEEVWCPSYSMPCGYGPEVKDFVFVLDDLMNMSARCKAALHQRYTGFSAGLKREKQCSER